MLFTIFYRRYILCDIIEQIYICNHSLFGLYAYVYNLSVSIYIQTVSTSKQTYNNINSKFSTNVLY
jgi:hypothetical protein